MTHFAKIIRRDAPFHTRLFINGIPFILNFMRFLLSGSTVVLFIEHLTYSFQHYLFSG